jgi:hypothetical protein
MNALASLSSLPVEQMRCFRLRVPVLLVWLLLLPLAPLLLLALLIACAAHGARPFRAVAALFRVFAGLKGINVEVQTRQVSIALDLF